MHCGAAQLSPSNPQWLYLQGVYQAESNLDAGLALLKRSVQLEGSVPTPRLVLAETLLQVDGTDEAAEHFQFVLRTDPENARALHGMGRVARNRGELRASLDYLKRSAAAAPRIQATHILLAQVHQGLGDQKHAEMERARAASLSANTAWPDPYCSMRGGRLRGQRLIVDRATALLNENRAEEAVRLVHELPESSVPWFAKHLTLGRAYYKLGDYRAAEKAFREALRLKPDSVEVLQGFGMLLKQQEKFSAAAEYLPKAVELQPEAGVWHFRLGHCLEMEGQTAEAIVEYREAVRLVPDSGASQKALGSALLAKGQKAEALTALERTCQLAPKDADARRRLDALRESLGLRQQTARPPEKVSPGPNTEKARSGSPD